MGQGEYLNYYTFDYFKDPVIEFTGCIFSDNLISPGRLYYKSGWIENDNLRTKHKKQAQKLLKLFSKNLSVISSPFSVSLGIRELLNNGFELELGKGGMRITKQNMNAS